MPGYRKGWGGVCWGVLLALAGHGTPMAGEAINKGDALVALRSARLYIRLLVWDKAKNQLQIATKADPGNAEAHFLLGAIYADADSADQMNLHFDRAALLRPGKYDPEIRQWRTKVWTQHYNNGVRYYQKDRVDEAAREFVAASRTDPSRADSTFAQTFFMAGLSYLRLGDPERGIEALRKGVELDPGSRSGFLNLGIAYHNAQRPAEAVAAFASAAAIDPRSAEVATRLLMGYETLAHATQDSAGAAALFDSALAACHRALEIDPGGLQVAVAAGRLHLHRAMRLTAAARQAEAVGYYTEAEGHLRQALQQDPKDGTSAFNLGLCYNQLNRPEDAVAMYQRAVEIDPKDADSWMQIGIAGARRKDFDGALIAFKKVVEVQPGNARAYEFLSAAFANKDMPREAREAFETAQALKGQGKQ